MSDHEKNQFFVFLAGCCFAVAAVLGLLGVACGGEKLPQRPRLPQAPPARRGGCPCADGGACTCNIWDGCRCGAGCACADCPGRESYRQARVRAVQSRSNLVVWVGGWSAGDVLSASAGLGWGWVHVRVPEYEDSPLRRVVVGYYEGGEEYEAGTVYDGSARSIRGAVDGARRPAYYAPAPSFTPAYAPAFGAGFFRGGGGGRRGGSC